MWLMKFFPLAFAVVWDKEDTLNLQVQELSIHRNCPEDFEEEIPVRMRPVVHPYWPEAPTNEHIMMFGQEAVFATARKS